MNPTASQRLFTASILVAVAPFAVAGDTVMCNIRGTTSLAECTPDVHYVASYPILPSSVYRSNATECPRVSTPTNVSPDAFLPSICVNAATPPPYAQLRCTTTSLPFYPPHNVVDCEAYPRSSTLSYAWLTSGVVRQTYPNNPLSNAREFSCSADGSGSVTVTITSPFGLSSTVSTAVTCATTPLPTH